MMSFEAIKNRPFKWHVVKFIVMVIFTACTITFLKLSNSQQTSQEEIVFRSRKLLSNTTEEVCEVHKQSSEQRCDYLLQKIKEGVCEDSIYPKLLYCYLKNVTPLFYIFSVFWIPIIFYLLGDTAGTYFVPALEKISEYLKLSPNVAGVTFLALGNGAPDLSTIIVGILTGKSNIGVGAPIGAGVFVTSVVVGLCTLLSNVVVTRRPFIRDVGCYLVAVLFIFGLYLSNKVYVWQGVIMLVMYVLYVALVVIGRYIYQTRKKKRLAKQKEMQEEEAFEEEIEDDDWTGGWYYLEKIKKQSPASAIKKPDLHERLLEDAQELKVHQEHFSFHATKEDIEKLEAEYRKQAEKELARSRWYQNLWDSFVDTIGWREMKWYYKIFFVLFDWIPTLMRKVSIFNANPKEWNYWLTICVPTFCPIVILYAIDPNLFGYLIGGVFPLVVVLIGGGAIVSLIIALTSSRQRPPIYFPVLVFIAFALSIVWIFVLVRELLSLLETIGNAIGVPQAVLAITIVAWGNSIGDTISNIVVARAGFPSMALGACFGGPLLNALIGLGFSFTFSTRSLTKGCYPVPPDPVLSLSFIFLVINLVTSLIVIPSCKFRSRKPYGVVLISMYVVYLSTALVAVLVPKFGNVFVWKLTNGC